MKAEACSHIGLKSILGYQFRQGTTEDKVSQALTLDALD
jgi:hypothetical protein